LESIGFTTTHSLIVIVAILAGSIILSLIFPKKEPEIPVKKVK